ncbi:MAG: metallophosphoesterase [Candidatus Andersenbacteria bacterium]
MLRRLLFFAGAALVFILGSGIAIWRAISSPYPYSFIFFGDAGEPNQHWNAIATSIVKQVQTDPIDGLFMLGDNIYDSGATSATDPRFAELYEKPFAPISASSKIDVVLGNHDVITDNGQGELDYAAMHAYWHLPSQYYADTYGPIEVIGLDSNQAAVDQVQLDFLREELTNDHAQLHIVLAHHPIYSSGLHGRANDQPWMHTLVQPVLQAGNADFFLAGHDHDFEAIKSDGSGVNYIVCGGAARPRPITASALSEQVLEGYTFCRLDVSKQQAVLRVYGETGEQLWQKEYVLR